MHSQATYFNIKWPYAYLRSRLSIDLRINRFIFYRMIMKIELLLNKKIIRLSSMSELR
jgi:hypothetical protein